MYLWWGERCAVHEGEGPRSSSQLALMIRTYAEECSVFEKFRAELISRPTIPVWSKPPEGFVKLNCDGAFRHRAVELGVQKIILATDAAAVIQALSRQGVDRSSASGLVWELKDLIHCNFV